ncbi:CC-NBS-LRR resistance protein, partial [Trifolium medium]|nr:CC-NBS-LRR resistance protein [Trifolium medium]
DEVQPALLLSYRYLPAPLKGCFAYCSIFPKNSILEKKVLVQLWIAEGLVPQPKSEKSWEKVAEEYFDELVSRSLIRQKSIDDEEIGFEMHDLFNDLAVIVSSPYCIRSTNLSTLAITKTVVVALLFCAEETLLLSDCKRLTELPKDMGKLVNLRHLDIRGSGLKEMPVQISGLENLQTLSDFVVSIQDVGLNIAHLGKYSNLRGNLSISQLQNVTDSSHAFQANLEMQKEIVELVLQWSDSDTSLSNLQIKSDVLEKLRPSTNLKSLTINGYGGNKFPNWLGGSLFGNMVCLRISHCENCSRLPPLGQLCNLKELFIGGMISVKSIDIEFYGSGSLLFQPFSFLETLEFDNMLEWEDWKLPRGTTIEFPRLKRLSLRQCPKLKGNIPLGQLRNLKELIIEGMNSLKTLDTEFYGSSNSPLFQPFPFLETLSFMHMQEWEEWKLIGSTSIEFPSLTHLLLSNCPKLTGNIPGNLPSLTSLSLNFCPKLKGMTPNNLPYLSKLELIDCRLLMEARPSADVFSQLMICLNFLRVIILRDIPSLTSFPGDGLPKTLQSLRIWKCENLDFLPHESFHKYKSLEDLEISDSCNSMTSFTKMRRNKISRFLEPSK